MILQWMCRIFVSVMFLHRPRRMRAQQKTALGRERGFDLG